ncbi:hypothetical protein evm_004699 [Chilo suppressalis]|nr:hypothetical protein evm_004699 [Chilo suppressalis]
MDVVYGTKPFSESGLFGRLEVVKPARETIREDSRKQLVYMTQERDGGALQINKIYTQKVLILFIHLQRKEG